MADLTERELLDLRYVDSRPGCWCLVVPDENAGISSLLERGLIEWLGRMNGYRITEAGRNALDKERG